MLYRLGTYRESDDDLLSQARCLLSLARERFTVLFGMGRGGSTLLWSSDKGVGIEMFIWTPHSDCLGSCFNSPVLPAMEEGVWVEAYRAVTLHCFSKL